MNSEVEFDGEASVLAALAGAASASALRFLGASSCSDSLEDEPEEAEDSSEASEASDSEAEEASDSADSEASEATSASESDSDELDSVSLSSTFLPLAALTATFFSDSLDEDESSESDSDDDSLATTLALAGAVFFLVSTSDSDDDDDEEESDDDSEEDSLALPLLTILELVSFLEDGLVTDFVVIFMLEKGRKEEDRRWVAKKLQILATLTGVKILNVDCRGMVPRLLFLFSFEINKQLLQFNHEHLGVAKGTLCSGSTTTGDPLFIKFTQRSHHTMALCLL